MIATADPIVDLTVPGGVRLRLAAPPAKVARSLSRRFAPWAADAVADTDAPDITIGFTPLPRPDGLVTLGHGSVGYAGDDFYLLDELGGTVRAIVPFDEIGQPSLSVRCAPDTTVVPFLNEIILVTLLGRGWAPLHASAVHHAGHGVVLMGWPKGGKTGAMLGFMAQGAEFVGDEWLVIAPDGRQVAGLPGGLSVAHWQLEHLPLEVPPGRRRLTSAIVRVAEATHVALDRVGLRRSTPAKLLTKGLPGLRRQLKVSVDPQVAFRGRVRPCTTVPETLFLLVAHADDRIAPRDVKPRSAASRMAHANVFEQREFFEAYRAYLFAYPDRANPTLDRAHAAQEEALRNAFEGRRIIEIRHPYGHPVDRLFRALHDISGHTTAADHNVNA